MQELKIDKEFKSLVDQNNAKDQEALIKSIQEYGCYDPITIWKGTIIDGHTRYTICKGYGIEFKTRELDLPDRNAVKRWILENQLARRNLTSTQREFLAARLSNLPLGTNQHREEAQNCASSETVGNAAKKAGVKERNVELAKTVIANADPEIVAAAESGKIKTGTAARAAKLDKPTQRRIAKADNPAKELKKVEAEAKAAEPDKPKTEMEIVVADLNELAEAVKAARALARNIFEFGEDKTPQRAYLNRFSYDGVIGSLTEYLRMMADLTPVEGTPKKPIVARDVKIREAMKK